MTAVSTTDDPTTERRRLGLFFRGRAMADLRPPLVPLLIVAAFALLAIFAPLLTDYPPDLGTLSARLLAPGEADATGSVHLLGTDAFGRDMFTRLLYGARASLLVGVVGVAMAAGFGSLVGLVAGVLGRGADVLLMRMVDVVLSVPPILVAIIFASVTTPSLITVFFVVALLLWPQYARLVRGEVLSIRELDYVALARVAGLSRAKIALRHVVPNVLPSVTVLATLHIGVAIILEASLSFLGVGLPPTAASWGSMVDDGRSVMAIAWWLAVLPGACIFLSVLSFNMIGDWARVRFDPRLDEVV